jgi:hypothetical protein
MAAGNIMQSARGGADLPRQDIDRAKATGILMAPVDAG